MRTRGTKDRGGDRSASSGRGVLPLLLILGMAACCRPAAGQGSTPAGQVATPATEASVPGTEPAVPAQAPAPPDSVRAFDTPNDSGGSITVDWALSPDDKPDSAAASGKVIEPSEAAAAAQLTGYRVLRTTADSVGVPGAFHQVAVAGRRISEALDTHAVVNGRPYVYVIEAHRGETAARSAPSAPAVATAQWFHKGRINTLIAVLVLSGLVIYFIEHARKGGDIFVRKIAGLDAVDEAVGRATEMGKKVLFIPGTADMDSVQTLAGMAILGRVARMTAQYSTPLTVPVSRSLVMVAGRETVKESYLSEGHPDDFKEEMVYYLTDDQFGYAAALDGIMTREKPATIFLQGSFYAEALILAETGNAVGAIQIAGTAEPSQLPFFVAACDYTLIGEELFVAGAYLSREPRQLGSIKGQDLGKAVILLLLLVGIVVETAHLFNMAAWFNVQ